MGFHWSDILIVLVAIAFAAAGATIRGRRTQRILGSDFAPTPPIRPPLPPLLDAPDVVGRLLAPTEEHPPLGPLLRDPALDIPALLDSLRRDFERQLRGDAPVDVNRSEAAVASVAARQRPSMVFATHEPVLRGAFSDERWTTVVVEFTALVEAPGGISAWVERWQLRRAGGSPWEIAQVLEGDFSPAHAPPVPDQKSARYFPWPAGAAEPFDIAPLVPMLAAVLEIRAGRATTSDALEPSLCAALVHEAEVWARLGGGSDLRGALTSARAAPVRVEGAVRVQAVYVEGRIEGEPAWRFRECWLLVQRGEGWRLWRAEAK